MDDSKLPRGAVSLDRYKAARPDERGSRVVFSFKKFGSIFRESEKPVTEEEIKRHKDLEFIASINTILQGPAPPSPYSSIDDRVTAAHILTQSELKGRFIIDNEWFDLDACVIDAYRDDKFLDIISAPDGMIDAYICLQAHINNYLKDIACWTFPGEQYYATPGLIIPDGGDLFDGVCVSELMFEEFDGYDTNARYLDFRTVVYFEPENDRCIYQLSVEEHEGVLSQVLKVGVVKGLDGDAKHYSVYEGELI
ncbi:hypothetical protein KY362_04615 [Candidatus Woesearchaeota archaeon]|nr:hypothetical protein [Candidatus Woesearchaeota archaeon]